MCGRVRSFLPSLLFQASVHPVKLPSERSVFDTQRLALLIDVVLVPQGRQQQTLLCRKWQIALENIQTTALYHFGVMRNEVGG